MYRANEIIHFGAFFGTVEFAYITHFLQFSLYKYGTVPLEQGSVQLVITQKIYLLKSENVRFNYN